MRASLLPPLYYHYVENMEKMERRFRVGGKQLLVFREMEVFLARVSLVEPRVENRFV